MQHTAWAAFDAFSAGQAVGICNRLSQPGMQTDIYPDRTIKRTNPTLDATLWLRNNMSGRQCLHMVGFVTQWKIHMEKIPTKIITSQLNKNYERKFVFIDNKHLSRPSVIPTYPIRRCISGWLHPPPEDNGFRRYRSLCTTHAGRMAAARLPIRRPDWLR